MGVYPCRLVFLHIDAAVAAVAGKSLIAANIIVRELRAGTEVHAPPRVMHEETTPVIENGIINVRRRVPERRTRRIIGLEFRRRLAILYRPDTGQRRTLDTACRHQESIDQLAVIVDAHRLLDE